jgi:hypothetical protein
MSKRKRGTPGVVAEAGADYGPSLRKGRDGRFRPWGGAVVLDIESRDDPDNLHAIVRGARRRDGLAELCTRRVITKRHVDAAEQFLDDCSLATGASACGITGMPSVHGARAGLPERQVAAITRINAVRLLLGLHSGTVFWWVVFGNGTVRDWEAAHKMRQGGAGTEMLRAALDALDAHYHGRSARRA